MKRRRPLTEMARLKLSVSQRDSERVQKAERRKALIWDALRRMTPHPGVPQKAIDAALGRRFGLHPSSIAAIRREGQRREML